LFIHHRLVIQSAIVITAIHLLRSIFGLLINLIFAYY